MTQQIDFLKSFTARENRLPALCMGLAALAILGICALISIAFGVYQMGVKQELIRVQEELAEATQNYAKLAEKYPLLASDKPLVDRVGEFEKNLRERQAHFSKLTHATSRRPFSKYMQTLSQIVPKGLWLTEISIDQDAQDISLAGYSLQAVSVSLFLEGLQSSAAFGNVVFDLFYVKKVKDKNYIQFEIANDKLSSYEEEKEKSSTNSNSTN